MKNLIVYAVVVVFAAACNMKETSKPDTGKAVSSEAGDNPYTLKNAYKNWQPGDQAHAMMVLKMLKAWENKKLEECATYFADSADMNFDYYSKKVSMDSLKPLLVSSQADYESVKIELQDWESVISEDKKDEWVTVWYKQSWVDKKGVSDSMQVVNDAKIENGKIAIFDEYTRHFASSKK